MALNDFNSHISLKISDKTVSNPTILAVALFIFGLSLFSSRFAFSPGIDVALPRVKQIYYKPTHGTLTLGRNGMIIFNDKILSKDNLRKELEDFIAKKFNIKHPCLLIRADQSIPLGIFLELSNIARAAGFHRIQIATERQF